MNTAYRSVNKSKEATTNNNNNKKAWGEINQDRQQDSVTEPGFFKAKRPEFSRKNRSKLRQQSMQNTKQNTKSTTTHTHFRKGGGGGVTGGKRGSKGVTFIASGYHFDGSVTERSTGQAGVLFLTAVATKKEKKKKKEKEKKASIG